jgi:hypothetical protein
VPFQAEHLPHPVVHLVFGEQPVVAGLYLSATWHYCQHVPHRDVQVPHAGLKVLARTDLDDFTPLNETHLSEIYDWRMPLACENPG